MNSAARAAMAVEFIPMLSAEAKKRQVIRKGSQPGAKVEKIPHLKARDEAAELTGTNGRYVSDAMKIKDLDSEVFDSL